MADYYPLIARAVTGLEKNTGDARRMLYERAREALVTQLRGATPPLSEAEITKERLALEEAIRKVEADTARRLRMEAQAQSDAAAAARASELARAKEASQQASPSLPPSASSAPAKRDRMPPASGADPDPVPPPPDGNPVRELVPDPEPPLRLNLSARLQTARKPLSDEGLKGFRDVVAETETIGRATAHASKAAREAFASVPTDTDSDRLEPRMESEALRPAPPLDRPVRQTPARDKPAREVSPPDPPKLQRRTGRPSPRPLDDSARVAEPRGFDLGHSARATARGTDTDFTPSPRVATRERTVVRDEQPHARRGLAAALVAVFFILALGGVVFWQRDRVALLFNAVKGTSPTAQREAAPTRPKINDRIGQPGSEASSGVPGASNNAVAAVAQRVVLYEEDPADPAGKRYVGTAVWRMDTIGSAGQQPELAVRADVEIPERRVTMTLTLRRNLDQTLPASHTIEIMFNLPADFPFGGISNVPGILMKQSEQTRGSPLAGLAVKVTSGFFLVGLSAVEGDQQRNLQLLRERSWFDIPIVYNNGRRAILAVEKGNPGDRAFETAFAAWSPSR